MLLGLFEMMPAISCDFPSARILPSFFPSSAIASSHEIGCRPDMSPRLFVCFMGFEMR
jgi:hypothetical protein